MKLIQHALNRKFYYEYKGSKKPILFLHGFLGSKMNWLTFSRILNEKHQHTVYGLDMMLHGDLQKFPIDCLTYENMNDFVVEFLDMMEIDSCHLVGHSMGGRTAAYTALLNKNRISSLTLVDIALNRSVEEGTRYILDSLSRVSNEHLEKFNNKTEIKEFLVGKIPKSYTDFLLQNLVFDGERKKYRWGFDSTKIINSYESVKNFDEEKIKNKEFSPVLLAYGEKSNFVRIPEDVDHCAAFFKELVVKKIKNAGHLVQIDNRQDLMEEIIQFIQTKTSCM